MFVQQIEPETIKVGIFGCGVKEWDQDVSFHIKFTSSTSTSPDFMKSRIETFIFNGTEEEFIRETPKCDVFFVYGIFFHENPRLERYLFKKLTEGKGMVVCLHMFHSSLNFGNFGVSSINGGLSDEFPCTKGEYLFKDGPKFMERVDIFHPILNGANNFDGGLDSDRSTVKLKKEKNNEEKISLVATWNDKSKTPMIIAKEYLKGTSKQNFGRLVVLNFWPVSSSWETNYWNSDTDGDKILNNSVIWASKKEDPMSNFVKKDKKFEFPNQFVDCIVKFS